MSLLNYSTKIDSWKTISEIQQNLAKAGASHFSVKNEGAEAAAVSFTIMHAGQPLNYLLPCEVEGIKRFLMKPEHRRNLRSDQLDLDKQARRVGWRIIKDWIDAQNALIAVNMASMEEVFLPYLIINADGQTLAKKILAPGGMKGLTL